jgi:hypothetical protein
MANTYAVRAAFDAYLAQDRDATERLLAETQVFCGGQVAPG